MKATITPARNITCLTNEVDCIPTISVSVVVIRRISGTQKGEEQETRSEFLRRNETEKNRKENEKVYEKIHYSLNAFEVMHSLLSGATAVV